MTTVTKLKISLTVLEMPVKPIIIPMREVDMNLNLRGLEVRGYLKEKRRIEETVIQIQRFYWKDYGCTLMADSWKDKAKHTLVNFIVYCPSAHVIDLVLEDLESFSWLKDTIGDARKILKFVYAHAWVLAKFKGHSNRHDLIRPSLTQFATSFIAILSIVVMVEPLLKVLRLVDSDKPTMGYLFDALCTSRAVITTFLRPRRSANVYLLCEWIVGDDDEPLLSTHEEWLKELERELSVEDPEVNEQRSQINLGNDQPSNYSEFDTNQFESVYQ
ncbi:hypothetical protein GIB67_012007 [Kingdonia uniflora]|uniref:DUF659 domain-containing protein n=1 Tax=Kingdonia uniflora TaxID=39325 RepID=A0A7J7M070_9MAGN|nr:hypothetical protein GIB67_012007 [Kingdonia uniflora]